MPLSATMGAPKTILLILACALAFANSQLSTIPKRLRRIKSYSTSKHPQDLVRGDEPLNGYYNEITKVFERDLKEFSLSMSFFMSVPSESTSEETGESSTPGNSKTGAPTANAPTTSPTTLPTSDYPTYVPTYYPTYYPTNFPTNINESPVNGTSEILFENELSKDANSGASRIGMIGSLLFIVASAINAIISIA